ncbi:Protein csx2 [Escovopsis weberi]|uniref:ADP-ribosylation factor GTPase-activating protein n=1 Tax=Escovopsis weberi TaxID=150374 RepID=A0A0M8MVQ9_ESCWE|nr:Protein csx2 [Escovopsis weberi]
MGNVSSAPDDGAALSLLDPHRLSLSSLTITSPRKRTAPIEYIQDPDPSQSNGTPRFLLKLNGEDELIFTFVFILRRSQTQQPAPSSSPRSDNQSLPADASISGLTFVNASTPRDVESLVTREFHANPNFHKNQNVAFVGDYSTSGSPSVAFEWTWKWRAPKPQEDKGGGWRNSCSFVEYNSRAHRLHTLATFSYWVTSSPSSPVQPLSPTAPFLLASPPKIRVASTQSVESRLTTDVEEPLSPVVDHHEMQAQSLAASQASAVRVDVQCPRPIEDATVADDGPVFRATLKALEQKTGNMRVQMKKVLKKAEAAHAAQIEANEAFVGFMDALREAASTNANAVQPALEHYFDKIAREILTYERLNTVNLQKIIIEPLSRFYQFDIKQAESKKRDFEEESKDYYAYVSRYLGQRQDSVKAKKLAESDSKYQNKRRDFELKRFDYSTFMQDLHGGRKEQEVLSHLTKYADAQTRGFMATAKKIEALRPQLVALTSEVLEVDKEYQYQRREREEKRRQLEKSNLAYNEPEQNSVGGYAPAFSSSNGNAGSASDNELGRADSTGSQLKHAAGIRDGHGSAPTTIELSRSPGSLGSSQAVNSPAQGSKFKGIRDLEERDTQQAQVTQRKEGLLWALNRPGGHVDPRNLNKQGWHKFWIVLDQGKLSEYSNWKQKLDLHMDPIDLRMASVREARNAERRFCFEVITPSFRRVYQATSEEDMNSWILSINNALQSAVEGRAYRERQASSRGSTDNSLMREIGSVLTGKTLTTVGARPAPMRTTSAGYDDHPDRLLQMLRDNDQGNCWCADCGSGAKVEWVSINLGITLCIECSGIHRSLGTHISKIRSLTLDIKSFTTDIVEMLLLIGNRVSNMVWEARIDRLDPAQRLAPTSQRDHRLRFITAKYVERAYVDSISPTLSRYATADETMLAAIKKNEIQQVLYALALKANPNVVDKMRGTHAVWLALAAADPASPSPTPGQTASQSDGQAVPFPVAELLVQNGAEIPSTMPAFPLGRHAQAYLEQKRGRGLPAFHDAGSTSANASGSGERSARDKEVARLQKRGSVGGRLAKSPIPEK